MTAAAKKSRAVRLEERIAQLKVAYPDGNYPAPKHDPGVCIVCDALRELLWAPVNAGS